VLDKSRLWGYHGRHLIPQFERSGFLAAQL
jgi:hypothetical protein